MFLLVRLKLGYGHRHAFLNSAEKTIVSVIRGQLYAVAELLVGKQNEANWLDDQNKKSLPDCRVLARWGFGERHHGKRRIDVRRVAISEEVLLRIIRLCRIVLGQVHLHLPGEGEPPSNEKFALPGRLSANDRDPLRDDQKC